jgi:glycosyltransferase involved in cell wall biosynthesis
MIDSLAIGGAERVAVNIVNNLPLDHYEAHLCVTRSDGPLRKLVAPYVRVLILSRRSRFDLPAFFNLLTYIRKQRIQIVHAHTTSLFIAVLAAKLSNQVRVVWHDHFGRYETEKRYVPIFRLFTKFVDTTIPVNRLLAEWAISSLKIHPNKVQFIPNGIEIPLESRTVVLPGIAGQRIVCVANLRRQKDHMNLISAMATVVGEFPNAHLLLVGSESDKTYASEVKNAVAANLLQSHVSFLGAQDDVHLLLKSCSIGVLSSMSEGLPLALLEYGAAGLPVVATAVGQCEEVLESGRLGIIVPPQNPDKLAQALIDLLASTQRQADLGKLFQKKVFSDYSIQGMINQVCHVYDSVLSR